MSANLLLPLQQKQLFVIEKFSPLFLLLGFISSVCLMKIFCFEVIDVQKVFLFNAVIIAYSSILSLSHRNYSPHASFCFDVENNRIIIVRQDKHRRHNEIRYRHTDSTSCVIMGLIQLFFFFFFFCCCFSPRRTERNYGREICLLL